MFRWRVSRGPRAAGELKSWACLCQGASFSTHVPFVLPPDAPGVGYGTARVELPTRFTGSVLPMLQEYQDNGTGRLMVFKIPAP